MRRTVSIGFLFLLLPLAACKDDYIWPDRRAETEDPNALAAFATADELESHLKRAIRAQEIPPAGKGDVILGMEPPAAESDAAPVESRRGDFSTTNLQEQGVDEADRLKSDGRYLYVLVQNEPAPLPVEVAPAAVIQPPVANQRLRILAMEENPPAAKEVASVDLPEGMHSAGSYLLNDREGGALLVVLGRKEPALHVSAWFTPWLWRSGKTLVTLFDVSDPTAPRQRHLLTFDGHLVASRRIGDTLYLVTRHYPWIRDYVPLPRTPQEELRNTALLEKATLADLLPRWRVDEGAWQPYLTSARSCYLPPMEEGRLSADVISIIAIDLRDPVQRPIARCLIGPTETLFMTRESLYLATTRHQYVIQREPGLAVERVIYPPEESTEIHKFTLAAGGPEYRGSASVEGHLGWEQDKKSFRMGEHEGALFVVTSLGRSWDGTASTRLTVLRERENGVPGLEEVARLPNEARPEPIGLPGERLYAARFLGERAYLVTFRVTDPLYVLDISDPADPFIAGSLKIPGYSDYLHPVNAGLLLGIGKSAVPAEEGDGRGAWYQGIKLALFDVSDPQDPKEVDSLEIGGRGTDSDALRDHHAVTWLAADPERGRPARLALPIELHDGASAPKGTDPSRFLPWTHTALYLFDIHVGESGEPGIVPRGQMVVASAAKGERRGYYPLGDRALLRGDDVHYLHGAWVWSAPWDEPEALVGPQ